MRALLAYIGIYWLCVRYASGIEQGLTTRRVLASRRRERRNLALALKDTRSVVGTLTYVMGAIMQLVFFFFYLLILQVRSTAG